MLEVLVLCEGQTDREFCREVVAPFVAAYGVSLSGTLVGKPQRKRGGIRPWQIYEAELQRLAKERDDYKAVAKKMAAVKLECGGSVEQINDSPQSAPSKRISRIVRAYDKVAWGVTAASDISIPTLREGCPWLDRWITRICNL